MGTPTRLTEATIKAVPAPARGLTFAKDDAVRGLYVRVTPNGARSFVIRYTLHGRDRVYTIGQFGPGGWSLEAARIEARRLRRLIDTGTDPMAMRTDARTAPTMADLCKRYLEDVAPRLRERSRKNFEAAIKNDILPALGTLRVADVAVCDVESLHRRITKRSAPTQANRVVSLVRRLLNLAERWGWREGRNPARGIERNAEENRRRYLKPDELARLIEALAAHPERTAADLIRFLLLTGARRGEAFSMTWDQVDFETGVWTKPSSHTKQKQEHAVPLSAPALALLSRIKENAAGPYVFPGRVPDAPLTDVKHSWRAICKAANIEGLRVHDLRHSYASFLVSAGLSLPVVGALLGHTQPGTTARYAHLLDEPLRVATEHVGAIVAGAGKPGAEVVPLRRDKGAA